MKDTKRQILPTGLWIVATPIGNLEDMTPRAFSALKSADIILCEDTRRTAALLSALGMTQFKGRLQRLDAHTESRQVEEWVEKMREGRNFALVTDAGTPGVSDPGSALVECARSSGIRITPVPGASAVVTLMSVSGFNETAFTFRGFFPRKPEDRRAELELAESSPLAHIYIWFESPIRILESLRVLSEMFPEVQTIVGKELTKIHEKLFWGISSQVNQLVREEIATEGSVGEWCFAIQFPKRKLGTRSSLDESDEWMKALKCLYESGVPLSESVKKVSQHFGTSKRRVYEQALQLFGKK